MTAPMFLSLDGVYRQTSVVVTTRPHQILQGSVPEDTVEFQVSINGAAFTDSPDLSFFEGENFIVPNLSAFPDGLILLPGVNRVEVRAILTTGAVSDKARVDIHLSQDSDIIADVQAPTGLNIERNNATVAFSFDATSGAIGFNVYATTAPGGGVEGYSRINPTLLSPTLTEESITTLGSLTTDALVRLGSDGLLAADPLFFNVRGVQQDRLGNVYQTDFNENLVLPDDARQLRVETVVSSVSTQERVVFVHDRLSTFNSSSNPAIPNSTFASIPSTDPLYYVATAVYLVNGVEVESSFSAEVSGSPLTVTTAVSDLPTVSRQQLVRDLSVNILRSQPQIQVIPGSTTRDLFIDPFSTEAERMRFLLDFMHRSQSFAMLLRVDDPNLTGTSIPVAQSAYKLALKQAFFLRSTQQVQDMLDSMFEARASNFGLTRLEGRRARGEVVFYVRTRPTSTIVIPIGTRLSGGSTSFRTTSYAEISVGGAGVSFDPLTGRYSAKAFIQAEEPGTAGNLSRGQISSVLGSLTGVSVTNPGRTFGGQDRESNRDLSVRAQRALASTDSGRLQGYTQVALSASGVRQVNVVSAGHPLMLRDVDDRGEHTGGKVDIYVRGESPSTVRDTFAFSFETLEDTQVQVVGDPSNLRFRVLSSRVTEDNPILEVLNFPEYGYLMRNATRGYDFDLEGVEIETYNQFVLSSDANDPTDLAINDVIFADVRFRTSNRYVFERQPVSSVVSLEGEVSGLISPSIYARFRGSDPLLLGRSTQAGDYLQVLEPLTPQGETIPSSDPVFVSGESHVLLEGVEYLGSLGINSLTVRVFSQDRSTEYVSPFDPSGLADYVFVAEEGQNPLGFRITSNSALNPGDTVVVDYYHDETFVVEYVTNSVAAAAQEDVDAFKHLTADVLVKEAGANPVDVFATVTYRKGASVATVRRNLRTSLTNFFSGLTLGQPIRQSDVLAVMDNTDGVNAVLVPLVLLAFGDGASQVRESKVLAGVEITSWSSSLVRVILITDPLLSATSDGGGPLGEFKAVYLDDESLALAPSLPDVFGQPLRNAPRSAAIIGSLGMSIPGFSDLTTLASAYPLASSSELLELQRELTANRVLISIEDSLTDYDSLTVTYTSVGDSGVKDLIDPGPVNYLTLGNLDVTLEEDEDFQAKVTGRR